METKMGKVVNCSILAVRTNPSKYTPIILNLFSGDIIQIDDEDGDWFHIYLPCGIEGYCRKEFIEVISDG